MMKFKTNSSANVQKSLKAKIVVYRVTHHVMVLFAGMKESVKLPAWSSSLLPATVQAIILVSIVNNVSTVVLVETVNITRVTRAFTAVVAQTFPVASGDSASPKPSASSIQARNANAQMVTGSMTIVSHLTKNVPSVSTVVITTAKTMAAALTALTNMVLQFAPVLVSSLGRLVSLSVATVIQMEQKTVLRTDHSTRVSAKMTGRVIDVT